MRARVLLAIAAPLVLAGCGSDSGASGTGGSAGSGASAGSGGSQGGSGGTGASAGSGGASGAGATGGSAGSGGSGGSAGGTPSGAWSMGYYASWQANQYPVSEIEWSGMTHIAVSFYMPDASGGLSLLGGNPNVMAEIVTQAHAHGVKAIASIGGADSGPSFQQATSSGTMNAFVGNLVALMTTDGYDGIDIDWEPLAISDQPAVIQIATSLRAAQPSAILTIPIGGINTNIPDDVSGYSAIADAYDQLNIMSYGMAGPWQGWNSWHSSPLYSQDTATPESIDSSVQAYLAAGVPKAKLGIGIGFYGLCYTLPVTEPDQPLNGSTITASDGTMSYAHIMESYYDASARKWDSFARAPYLSFSSATGPEGCSYISYDDEQSIAEKGAYLKAQGLGGVIQWEINEGYLSSAPAGQKNPLLSAIHDQILQ
jgi:chitinase